MRLDDHRQASPGGIGNAFTGHCVAVRGDRAGDLENGNPSGLDTVSVMEKYGTTSTVYRAFIQLDGAVLTAEEQNGNTGLLTTFVSQVRELCRQYGAPAGQGQP